MTKDSDPLDINQRLYKQLGKLLDDMEKADADETMTFPQRISALIAVGRVQKMFVDLRKGEFDVGRGTAIDRYATAFASTDAARRGEDNTGFGRSGSSRDEDDIRDELGDA
jgi:hypothetical protein